MGSDPPTFDLQCHSLHSDGALAPREVVAAAADAGIKLVALSDHDTTEGVAEALGAAQEHGIRLVPAVEISARDRGEGDLHTLGYAIDHRDSVLAERLRGYRSERERRADAMTSAIRALGFELDEGKLHARRRQGKSIGRPHLAEAVLSAAANRERLAAERIAEASGFLEAYLIEGRPAFCPRSAPSIAQAIEVIHDAGGVAVWAHPFWDLEAPDRVIGAIDRFRSLGLDGVECFYPTHSREQAELLADYCTERGLLSTGSSDFHGPRHREFSRFGAFSTYGRAANLGPLA